MKSWIHFIVIVIIGYLISISYLHFVDATFQLPYIRLFYISKSGARLQVSKYNQKSFNHQVTEFGDNTFHFKNVTVTIGKGNDDFLYADELLTQYRMVNDLQCAQIITDSSDNIMNKNLATMVKCFGFIWTLNPCRIINACSNINKNFPTDLSNVRKFSEISYGTLDGHLISGVEKFRIILTNEDDVLFQLYSHAKGCGLLGRIVYPLIKIPQQMFINEVINKMKELSKKKY